MNEYSECIIKAISERRTIKPDQYSGEKIEDRLIRQILESANWAPTHGYTEPWRFVVFSEDGLAGLGNFLATLDQPDQNSETFNQMRFERLRSRPLNASHVIGVGMKRGNNPKIPKIEEICSVAMAVQNMWLTAHSLGLGAYWSTGEAAYSTEMRNFLRLGEEDLSLGLFYIGKPNIPNPVGRRLSKIDDKVEWIKS